MNQVVTSEGFILREKIAELESLLTSKHPKMPILLREIHTALRAQPENVTLLSEQEISVIVNGLKVQTGVEFATASTKGSGNKSAVAKIKNLGADAF